MPPKGKISSRRPVTSEELKSFEWLVIGAGLEPKQFFRRLKQDLARTADPIRAANNLHRFLTTGFSSTILHDFERHPVLRDIALELFAQSQYLADILVRDTELFRWLTTSNALKLTKTRSEFIREALASSLLFTRLEKKMDSVKRFHRREMLRIGARDILKEAGVAAITGELSGLADAVVEVMLELGHRELNVKTGAYFKNSLCVIGLGKLGGEELNFSSDIDLLFVYDEDGEFEAPHERIRTFHEYYNRLAEFVVRKLTEFSSEGHLYRVDMRLRPEGSAGPLALSRLAYKQYYEIRGSLWERQMLLKARPIAGNLDTGRQFLGELRPFIFPKTSLTNPIEEIRDMKIRIEQQKDQKGNIKLGEGGIRDIEFVVQALQLTGGGENPSVRVPNTLLALTRLTEEKRIGPKDSSVLARAYQFFRTLEHRLQLLHGTQTHSLPETAAETALLARRLGFSSGQQLTRRVNWERRAVRRIFDAVFREKKTQGKINAVSALAGGTRELSRYGFKDIVAAEKTMDFLSRELPPFHDAALRNAALSILKKHGAPDWGLANFARLADSASIRRTLNQSLYSPELSDLLIHICSRSRMTTELLAREPLLFETIAGQPEELFTKHRSFEFLLEHDLARFKTYNEFKILLPFLIGDAGIDETTRSLSLLADDLIEGEFRRCAGSEFMGLVAMGKLGGSEITVRSDLDLIILYDGDLLNVEDAERAAKQFSGLLADHSVYNADFRLRPEGKNAPLATEISYYREYLTGRASLWERQSLTKARFLCGNSLLREQVRDMIRTFAFEAPLPEGWIENIRKMKQKMEDERAQQYDLKVGKGGLVDLEFAIQVLQLRYGGEMPSLRKSNSLEAVREIRRAGVLTKAETTILERNILLMRTAESILRLNTEKSDFAIPDILTVRAVLRAFINSPTEKAMQGKIKMVQNQNRRLLLRACALGKQ